MRGAAAAARYNEKESTGAAAQTANLTSPHAAAHCASVGNLAYAAAAGRHPHTASSVVGQKMCRVQSAMEIVEKCIPILLASFTFFPILFKPRTHT